MKEKKYSDAIGYINNLLKRNSNWVKIQFWQCESLAYMGITDKARQVLFDL